MHQAIFNKWTKSRANYKKDVAEKWVNQKPAGTTAEDLLSWAKQHPFLKIRRNEVPLGILPMKAFINDIGVKPPKCKRRIIDDDLYDAFPFVRMYIPRGTSVLEIYPNGEQSAPEYHLVIFAMKKFTGGQGDDDDQSDEAEEGESTEQKSRWEHYFLEPITNAKYIYNTTKENGEASHVGAFEFQGQRYFVIGSKNVHLLVQKAEQIDLYTDNCYMVRFKNAN
jgi:hypothetical protein